MVSSAESEAKRPPIPTEGGQRFRSNIRYRYYVSTPVLHGEAKTASAGSVSRVPAADIEDVVVKFLKEYLAAKQDKSITSAMPSGDRGDLVQRIAGIVVHKDKLVVRFKSDNADEASDSPDDHSLTIPWQKPPSKRSRQILIPHNASRSDVRPEQFYTVQPGDKDWIVNLLSVS